MDEKVKEIEERWRFLFDVKGTASKNVFTINLQGEQAEKAIQLYMRAPIDIFALLECIADWKRSWQETDAMLQKATPRIEELEEKVLRVVRGEFKQICSYCGWESREGQWEELQAHLRECERHPLKQALDRVKELEILLGEAQQWIDSEPDWKQKYNENYQKLLNRIKELENNESLWKISYEFVINGYKERIKELEERIEKHREEKEQTSILGVSGQLLPAKDDVDEELYKLIEK